MADPITPPASTEPAAAPPAVVDPPAPAAAPAEVSTTPSTLLGGVEPPAAELGADGKPKGDEQTDPKDAKPAGAPEKYELTAPEGMTLDTALLGKFEPLFRKADLSQELAQELVAQYAQIAQEQQKSQAEAWGKQIADWGEAVKTDKEIGGEALEANTRAALTVMAKYGTPELKALMGLASPENPTGLGIGNHPELVRLFVKLGKAMGEDTFHTSNGEAKEPKAQAQKFYPGMNP